jgi:hypothetical protein
MASSVQDDALEVGDAPATGKIPELDRLQLHNLLLQQQLCREQLNALTLQFLQTVQPRALQERIEEIGRQINILGERVFADAHVDAQAYQLNLEDGSFVSRSQTAVKK